MPSVVVAGGGVVGLCAAMLLARDGHDVTVLERNPSPPPDDPRDAWASWERRGVNQFRLLHYFQPRFRVIVADELPEVEAALDAAGALRFNFVDLVPEATSGGRRPGDDRYEVLTGRRPVVEAAVAKVAEAEPRLTIRRGVAVTGLVLGPSAAPGVPHVAGVRTDGGEELTADLVVDMTGRRSPLPRWLADVGARPPREEADDCGFVYHGRHFRSPDGTVPPMFGSLLQSVGSVSVLTLPADNGTWGVGVISSGADPALRGLRHVDAWTAVVRSFPLVAHWLDGEPLDDGVVVMASIEDRIRDLVVDGEPVVTGLVAVGDSWACTNPSVGRGASIGLLQARALRDLLRCSPADDPRAFSLDWATVTERVALPWYRETVELDRHRLAEVDAAVAGVPYEPSEGRWTHLQAIQSAAMQDPEVFRALLGVTGVLRSIDEVMADDGMAERVATLGGGWRDAPRLGPTREELVRLASGAEPAPA